MMRLGLITAMTMILAPTGCATTSGAPSPEVCAKQHGKTSCFWRGSTRGYCGGAPPPPEIADRGFPECICDGCRSDADCKARPGGSCQLVPSRDHYCVSAARVCLYKGDRCPPKGVKPDRSSPGELRWNHDGKGEALCAQPYEPRP